MIRNMYKLNILAHHREKDSLLHELRALGVVHITMHAKENNDEVEVLVSKKSKWQQALQHLEQYSSDDTQISNVPHSDSEVLKSEITQLIDKLEHINQQEEILKKEKAQLDPWGNFSWDRIQKLEEKEIFTTFFQCSKKEFKALKSGSIAIEIISQNRSNISFVTFTQRNEVELDLDPIDLPKHSISEIDDLLARLTKERAQVIDKLKRINKFISQLQQQIIQTEENIEFAKVKSSFRPLSPTNEKIIKLTGWIPFEELKPTINHLNAWQISYSCSAAASNEKVPVVLKNKKYPKLFEQITKIFQLPDYNEFDLTPFIAVFYPIFFAYCLGDAGYGFILLALSITGSFTFFKKSKSLAYLGSILGVMTMITGIIKSGVIFGISIPEYQDIPLFQWMSQYIIITDDQSDLFNSFNVALMIGVFQILVAIIISILKKIRFQGFKYAISNIGKLLIIVSLLVVFLGGMQHMKPFLPYQMLSYVTLSVGIALVLLFNEPDKPITKRLAGGILPLYFIVTGFMGDALSYIRLFALGVASSILGLVVNQIGNQIMADAGVVMLIIGIIFLIIGHTFNLALACLGAFVHPLRLTFVEFYNNAEFEGGGIPYKPFKKKIIDTISSNT